MRVRAIVWFMLTVVALVPSASRSMAGQEVAFAGRSPRFLYVPAKGAKPVETDASRHAVFRKVVSLQIEQPTVRQVIAEIERQAGLTFVYDDRIRMDRSLTLRADAITVGSALAAIFYDAGVDVVLSPGGHVGLVDAKSAIVRGQGGTITGRVTDAKAGSWVAGVDVSLDGTRRRVMTDADGRYRFADVAPGNYTVLARRIGYGPEQRPVTVAAGQEAVVDVTLQPAAARLGDLVVTAEKREERLQEVPVPVTAIAAENLVNSNQLRLQDYYASVPSLSLVSNGIGEATLTIRGIATGGVTNPTVGVTVDDVPFGTPIGYANNTGAPDLDPNDLERIEVLRGPQGTLYGASSIGGLLKFVTVDPSTDRVSGRVQADLSAIQNGDAAGYGFRGAINVPVSSTLAVRASGFTRHDPGYIDVPALQLNGVNDVGVHGGRLSTLWHPSATWSLKLSALLQNRDADGTSDVNIAPELGELEQLRFLPTQGYHQKARSYAATVSGHIGSVEVVSLSGYSIDISNRTSDASGGYFSNLADATFGVTGAQVSWNAKTTKFTQELRLSGSFLQRFDWLAGGFYSRDNNTANFNIDALDVTTLSPGGLLHYDYFPTRFKEYAFFGNLTAHVTDRFDVQIGARGSHNRQVYEERLGGPLYESFGYIGELYNPPVHTKEGAFTYLVAPRFKLSPDLIVYGRFASGYRPGGPNPTCVLFPVPCQYAPDKTKNYELGVKGEVFNHRLSLDASIYRIDWSDIQLQVADPVTGFFLYTNASAAQSRGIELSAQARPLNGLTLAGWVAWTDAKLTRDLPPTGAIGAAGDRLPYSSPFSANVSLDQEFSLQREMTATVGAAMSYVGDRESRFSASTDFPRLELASYTQATLRAGIRYQLWAINLYVNNVADERGMLSYRCSLATRCVANLIQPRAAGLSLVRTF